MSDSGRSPDGSGYSAEPEPSCTVSAVPVSIPNAARILTDDHPLLRTVSEPIAEFGTDALYGLLATMEETLRSHNGRGLAAVQIGVPLRVLMIRQNGYYAMINPTLERTLNRHTVEHEGCLSVPVFRWGLVSRPAKCDAIWFNPDGEKRSATLTGDTARIFQHEFDHLNGVLMTDHIAQPSAGEQSK